MIHVVDRAFSIREISYAYELSFIQPVHQFAENHQPGNLVAYIEPGPVLWLATHGNTATVPL